MKITLDFNNIQTDIFIKFLEVGYDSLQTQIDQLEKSLAKDILTEQERANINDYLTAEIAPPYMLINDLLSSLRSQLNEEKTKPKIIT